MQTSVKLQEPLAFSYIPLIVFAIVCVIAVLVYFFFIREKREKKITFEVQDTIEIKNIFVIKDRYIAKIVELDKEIDEGLISLRDAYQKLSMIVREFVYEVTDVTVQNFSLAEIKEAQLPELAKLIEEFYKPEFEAMSEGDVRASVFNAKRVVELWN